MTTLGERIKNIRQNKGITTTFVARKLGYKSPSSVSDFENGRTKIDGDKLPIIASALGVTIEELFFDQNVRETRILNEISING